MPHNCHNIILLVLNRKTEVISPFAKQSVLIQLFLSTPTYSRTSTRLCSSSDGSIPTTATLEGRHELLPALEVGVCVTSVQKCMFFQTQGSREEEEHCLLRLSWRLSENMDGIEAYFRQSEGNSFFFSPLPISIITPAFPSWLSI